MEKDDDYNQSERNRRTTLVARCNCFWWCEDVARMKALH